MKVSIDKSEIKGKIIAPSSKSYTIRGLMCAALANGESKIMHPLSSDDTEAASSVLKKVGINIHKQRDCWPVSGGHFNEPTADLFCRDSAATLRFMTAISSLVPGRCRLVPGPSLAKRPIQPILEALRQLGVDCRLEETSVVVEGSKLKGGTVELSGDISSQFISALLLIAPLAEEAVSIRLTTPLESKPYILMTLECLKEFGIKVTASANLREFEVSRQKYSPTNYEVEGDWSSASYFLALGAISGQVEVLNLNPESLQGDKIMLNLLRDMGAQVSVGNQSVAVRRSTLKAITADLADCIDLLPTLGILAAVANGVSQFTGIDRARLKESNRVSALREGLKKMGIKVTEERDRLIIVGSEPKGSAIDSRGDHRIAMAFSILGLSTGGTTINGAECVSKTYPDFWDILKSLGSEVKLNGE